MIDKIHSYLAKISIAFVVLLTSQVSWAAVSASGAVSPNKDLNPNGEYVTLSWSSSGAVSCRASNSLGGGSLGTSGSKMVRLSGNGGSQVETWIQCADAAGNTTTARVGYTFKDAPPPPPKPSTPYFTSAPNSVVLGDTYSLSWNKPSYTKYFTLVTNGSGSTTYSTSATFTASTVGETSHRIRACGDSGCSSYRYHTVTVEDPAPPPVPSSFTLDNLGNNPITDESSYKLTWGSSTGATYYQFVENGVGSNTTSTSKSFSNKPAGQYNYSVTACHQYGCSSARSLAVTIVHDIPETPTTPVTNNASPLTEQTYRISWGSESTATHYVLYEDGKQAIVNGTSKSFTKDQVGSHTYSVSACNAQGCSNPTASLTVTMAARKLIGFDNEYQVYQNSAGDIYVVRDPYDGNTPGVRRFILDGSESEGYTLISNPSSAQVSAFGIGDRSSLSYEAKDADGNGTTDMFLQSSGGNVVGVVTSKTLTNSLANTYRHINSSYSEAPQAIAIWAYVAGLGTWIDEEHNMSLDDAGGSQDSITRIRARVAPRPYTQVVEPLNCSVNPGETTCVKVVSLEYPGEGIGRHTDSYSVRSADGTLTNGNIETDWRYDGSPAAVSFDENWHKVQENEIAIRAIDKYTNSMAIGAKVHRMQLILKDGGSEIALDPIRTSVSAVNTTENPSANVHDLIYSYEGVESGRYDVFLEVDDGFIHANGNSLNQQRVEVDKLFLLDAEKPVINIVMEDASSVPTLESISVEVLDNLDVIQVNNIQLKGGPEQIDLPIGFREIDGHNQFKMTGYPVIRPSSVPYTVTVEAQDESGNLTTQTASFVFNPEIVPLSSKEPEIKLPAVTHLFPRKNGTQAIYSDPVSSPDGQVANGVYEVYVKVDDSAQVGLSINGVSVSAGDWVELSGAYDFSLTDGRINMPMLAMEDGVQGTTSLQFVTSAPYSPIFEVDVSTWAAEAVMDSELWEFRQAFDPVLIRAAAGGTTYCKITSNEFSAKSSDTIAGPECLLEWDSFPAGVEEITHISEGGVRIAALGGDALELGTQTASYTLYLYDNQGAKVVVGSGDLNYEVVSAEGAVAYGPENDTSIMRVIEELRFTLEQTHGDTCRLTIHPEASKRDAAMKQVGVASRLCLLEWTNLPSGLYQQAFFDTPELRGHLQDIGDYTVGWDVSLFTSNGTKVLLAREEATIEATDPPAPTIDLMDATMMTESIIEAPTTGGYMGDLLVESASAKIDLTIERNEELVESETHSPRWGETSKLYRHVNADIRNVWDEVDYSVTAAYTEVPEIQAVSTFRAVVTPPEHITPIVEVENNTVVDSELLPISARIGSNYDPDMPYDESKMGVWRVRLMNQLSYNNLVPLTDFVDMSNGMASFDLDISNVEGSRLKLVAEAVLESPIPGYSRTATSSRAVYLTILRGNAIDADVEARTLSGQAPFHGVFQLALKDRLDSRATGAVIWETSSDGGVTWEQYVPDERRKYQYVRVFELGEYKVRAKVTNANSGVESYTEAVDVVAYNVPQIEIAGPQTILVGSTGTYSATVTLNGEEVSPEDVIVEWSEDGGQTYPHTGWDVSFTREMNDRFPLWARVRALEAPEDDHYAYETAKTAVTFREVRPPRAYVTGPRTIETGKTYEFAVDLQMPYRGMEAEVDGFFTMPDGSTVSGTTASYTPTEEDMMLSSVDFLYTAWIVGYRDQGGEDTHTHRAKVWQYVWPEFGLNVRTSADVAPAQFIAKVRTVAFNGNLDEPVYGWDIPAGAIIEDDREEAKVFTVTEPGNYTLGVTITDARGNEAYEEFNITIGEAEPYEIELQLSGSNEYDRAPLDVLIRPYVFGGHPRDRIEERLYLLNGEPLEGSGSYGRATLPAGDHTLELQITSQMGHVVKGSASYSVAENQLPTCEITYRDSFGAWKVQAVCNDVDGSVRQHIWHIDGEKVGISTSRIIINQDNYEAMPVISVKGIDDAGGESPTVSIP